MLREQVFVVLKSQPVRVKVNLAVQDAFKVTKGKQQHVYERIYGQACKQYEDCIDEYIEYPVRHRHLFLMFDLLIRNTFGYSHDFILPTLIG